MAETFENILSIAEEDIEFELRGLASVTWADFLLNPRRLRGSDFLMRWSQGVWSERRLIEAVNDTREFLLLNMGLVVPLQTMMCEPSSSTLRGWKKLDSEASKGQTCLLSPTSTRRVLRSLSAA